MDFLFLSEEEVARVLRLYLVELLQIIFRCFYTPCLRLRTVFVAPLTKRLGPRSLRDVGDERGIVLERDLLERGVGILKLQQLRVKLLVVGLLLNWRLLDHLERL